jgi:hypothetical protein
VSEPHRHTSVNADERNCRIAAKQVEQYWHKQGHLQVRAWVEPTYVHIIQSKQKAQWWITKTNLVNGLPPHD